MLRLRKSFFTKLVSRYSEPHRFYHTLQHMRECFSVLAPASHLARRRAELLTNRVEADHEKGRLARPKHWID